MSLKPNISEIAVHEFAQDELDDRRFDLFPLLLKTEESISEPHRHNYYELFFFENGGGSHIVDFHELPIDAMSAHVIAPGQVHHLKRSKDSVGFAILFMDRFLRNNPENSAFVSKFAYMEMEDYVPVFQFSKEEFDAILQLVGMMQKEHEGDDEYKIETIRHYLNILLLSCRRKSKLSKHVLTPDQILYADFLKQIDQHFIEHKKVMEYVKLLNTNERQLNEVSQSGSGKSASTLIYDRIMMESKRLLVNTTMSVKEICFALNYEDQAHFSKFFKKQSKYTPSQFRELYK
jgi:AraC family transcriptional activator of pobA